MKRKNLSRELTFGLTVIGALFLTYFGLNFLKGINIFSPTYTYYAQYGEVGGLVVSSPVYVKGYKVGQVDEIAYDFSKATPFTVRISVSKDIRLPHGTIVELFDDGLMGGKAIRLLIPTGDPSASLYQDSDMIESNASEGLLGALANTLLPKIESISQEADSLIRSLRKVVEDESLANTLASAEKAAADLAATSGSLKKMMANDVPQILGKTDVLLGDITDISGNLKQIDFQTTFNKLDHTLANINSITDKINDDKGTLGALLNDRELYLNLLHATSSADSLLVDLKRSPKRYVHFSLFGGKKN